MVTLSDIIARPDGLGGAGRERVLRCVRGCMDEFGHAADAPAVLAVAPGRVELCGNHTDHQRGRVLCAAAGPDMLACAVPNGLGRVRVCSEGFARAEICLPAGAPVAAERATSAALLRGVAAGYATRGFDAYVASDIPPGGGISSSAAFELLLAVLCERFSPEGGALTALERAERCRRAENEYFGKPCGLLDQAAIALGGVQELDFAAGCAAARVDFDFGRCGHRMCVVDTRSAHADLTADYAAIADECRAVAARFGAETLREVDEGAFYGAIPELRRSLGDRAVLRAMHVFAENARAGRAAGALRRGDFAAFLREVDASGRSSAELLQNLWPGRDAREQPLTLALALARGVLGGAGACRVHGGGFGGTMLAFVPEGLYGEFSRRMEAVFGPGSCLALRVRSAGAGVIEI